MGMMIELKKGNFEVVATSKSLDELGELARMTGQVTSIIKLLIQELKNMSTKFDKEGDIEAQIDTSQFHGSYHVVAEDINRMARSMVNEMLITFDCIEKIASGDFEANILKQIGKKVRMNESIDFLRASMRAINQEITVLVGQAKIGNLSERVAVENYRGDWVNVISNLNELLEEIILPINEAADVLNEVTVGHFNVEVKGNYQGDFLIVKNSINNTVKNVRSYIEEISSVLLSMANDDLTKNISREYVGDFSSIKDSVNKITEKFSTVMREMNAA